MAKPKRVLWSIEHVDLGESMRDVTDTFGRTVRYPVLVDEVRLTPYEVSNGGYVGKAGEPLVATSEVDAALVHASGNAPVRRLEALKKRIGEVIAQALGKP